MKDPEFFWSREIWAQDDEVFFEPDPELDSWLEKLDSEAVFEAEGGDEED